MNNNAIIVTTDYLLANFNVSVQYILNCETKIELSYKYCYNLVECNIKLNIN